MLNKIPSFTIAYETSNAKAFIPAYLWRWMFYSCGNLTVKGTFVPLRRDPAKVPARRLPTAIEQVVTLTLSLLRLKIATATNTTNVLIHLVPRRQRFWRGRWRAP